MSEMHTSLHGFLSSGSSAVISHLWLSTFVLALALVAARVLPRLRARTRFLIVLLGLAKFFLPSGFLMWLSESARTEVLAMFGWQREQLPVAVSFIFDSPVDMDVYAGASSEVACFVFLTWAAGAGGVLALALVRRRLVLHHVLSSASEPAAREASIFARIQNSRAGLDVASLRMTKATTSPAVVGVFRPVVFLPEGSTDSLTDAEVEGVLTHEIAHILRFDNLTALLQLIASALFWFHPLVWFAHRRLLIERELACDEAVIDLGLAPSDYVSGVLQICRRAAGPRVAAVACIRSTHLSERMEYVMRYEAIRHGLFSHKKVSLFAAGVVVLATVAAATIGGALPASASTPPSYSMTATVIEVRPGVFRCDIDVRDGEGVVIASPRLQIAGGEIGRMSTSSEARLIEIKADLNEKGNGPITLEVREKDAVVASQTLFAIARKPGEITTTPVNGRIERTTPPGILRVGGDVKAPRAIHREEPVYPAEARNSRVTGVVILEAVIDEAGKVGDVTVLKGLPFGLSEAAADAVRQWKFAPATKGGVPVPVLFNLTINFRLASQEPGAGANSRTMPASTEDRGKEGVLRVEGDVVAPRLLNRVAAQYTPEARTHRVAGVVIIEAHIDLAGRVVDTKILKNLPFGLGESAAGAVRQWIFQPATLEGRPVPVLFNVTVMFRPDGDVAF